MATPSQTRQNRRWEPAEIRRIAIAAMFSDDVLMDALVLKGGNALDLVHGLSARGSYDIDFSIEGDFANTEDISNRIFRALRDRFDAAGLAVFDERFGPQPKTRRPGMDERWGGYKAEFKLIDSELAAALGNDIERMRRQATELSATHDRVFKIEISKHEYVEGKVERELDAFTIFVYSTEMIAIEKLRALCQQMPEYEMNPNGHARARDFYDIYTIGTTTGLNLSAHSHDMIRGIFAAKDVPLGLLALLDKQRELHRSDWPSVLATITSADVKEFDFYFDYVLDRVSELKPLWDV